MLEEECVRKLTMIHGEIDNGCYRSRRSAYSGKVSSNVDHLVDRVLTKHYGKQKAKMPWKKVLTVVLALFMVLAAIPYVLSPLYGGFESDVSVVLDPDGVRLNETLSINVSIPSYYNITSVSVVVPNVETVSLSLVDNSTSLHLWHGVWVVHTLPPGEHIITIRALDSNNTSYSVGTRLTVLPDDVPVDNESIEPDDNETVPPDTGDGNVPVPPNSGDDNESENETVIPPSLDLSLFLDKAAYVFDELVSINGSVLFNNSLINTSVNLSVFGPVSNLSFSMNASNGSFYHEFVTDAIGNFVIWANASFGNLSIWDKLDFSVFEDHGYEPEIVSDPVDLPPEVGDKILENEDVQVILQYTPGTNLTIVKEYLESIGFVPTAEISSSGFIAGVLSKDVYDSIKFNGDILSIYEDQGFTVLLSESLPLVRHDDVVSEFNLSGSGKKICIIDTGVDSSIVNYSYGYDFVHDDSIPDDEYGHGTKVAAVIKSIAPGAELVVAKVIDGSGVGYESDVLEALEWCIAQSPDVISFSIGSVGVCDGFCDTSFVADMANNAVDSGIFVVAASGNDGSGSLRSPACGSKVFSVGATDDFDVIAGFSNVNPTLDLFAPGVDITSIAGSGSGTSFSAPHVSSAALLVLENEILTPAELKYRFRSTGVPVSYVYNESISLDIARLDIYNAVVNNKTLEPYDYSWWWQGELGEGGLEYEPLSTSIVSLLPDSEGTTQTWSVQPPEFPTPIHWTKVDDPVGNPDVNTYVYTGTSNNIEEFNHATSALLVGAEIHNVRVIWRVTKVVSGFPGTAAVGPGIKIGGNRYAAGVSFPITTTSYVDCTADWPYNPDIAQPPNTNWTEATIASLQSSIQALNLNAASVRCTQVYINVTYTPANAAPTLSGQSPTNGSSDICPIPDLYVIVTDTGPESPIIAEWRSNSSGSWATFAANVSITSGDNITQTNESFSAPGTKYWWSVNVTDKIFWTNETYSFTTNYAPMQAGESPTNGSSDIARNASGKTLYVNVKDNDPDTMDAYWYYNESGSWWQFGYNYIDFAGPGGTNISQLNSNFSNFSSTYYWSLNITDGCSWTNTTYHFTTESADETISVTPASWDLGTTTIGSYNISTGPYFNLSNDGSTALDIQVKSSNATNSTTGATWVVNDTAGLDNFTIGFNLTGGDTWTLFNYSYVTFINSLAVSSWQLFDLNITMATMATKHDPLNLTLTFRAVAS